MDSLHDILRQKDFDEPMEATSIKQYVQHEFQTVVSVSVRERDIVIGVSSAALANTLRLRGPVLKKLCQTDKRFTFRIG